MSNNVKLAAFDIDGTLSTGVLSLSLLEELVNRGLFSKQVFNKLHSLELDYAKGKLEREEMSELWLQNYLQAMKGNDPEQYIKAAAEVWEKAKDNTFDFVEPMLNKLTEKGYTTLVISASPDEIVRFFCQANSFSVDRFRATKVKLDQFGKYTDSPEVTLSLAKHKLEQLNDLANNLFPDQEVDWQDSLAMGDSYSDLEMLKAIGKPVVMKESTREANELVKIAEDNNWTVVDENNALEKILALI